MRKFKVFGVLVAVFAVSAIAAAGASATLWLVSNASLTSATTATVHGTLEFNHTGGTAGATKILCSGLIDGKVGPGAQDSIELFLSLSGTASENDLVKCTAETGFCLNPVVHVKNLPWKTLLKLVGTTTIDEITESGSGMPTYEVTCTVGSVSCARANSEATFIKNGTNGAEFEFTEKGTETTCSDGGKGWLIAKGENLNAKVS